MEAEGFELLTVTGVMAECVSLLRCFGGDGTDPLSDSTSDELRDQAPVGGSFFRRLPDDRFMRKVVV